jgi:hypothetical protein
MPGAVTIGRNQIEKVFRHVELGTMRALNRSMATARTQAVREVAKELGIAQAPIRERIVQDRATLKRLETTLRFTGKRLRLIDLGAKQTATGVTYRGHGGRALVRGAFLATMQSGHTGVFKRKLPTLSRKGRPRSSPALPIRELYGLSVPFVATKQHILESTLRAATEAFAKNSERDIAFATSSGEA